MTSALTATAPARKWPAGAVTPHGWYDIVNDVRPLMWLDAYDGSIHFDMLGGYAPPFHDPTLPEAVAITDLKGLIPPWKHITQKGATEDGVTQIDALYDPIAVQMTVECMARDQKNLRRVVTDLIASLDAKQESTLGWYTQELGKWWAPIVWFEGGQPESLGNLGRRRQKMSLRLAANSGFWRSDDDVAMLNFAYTTTLDSFTTDYRSSRNLGPVPQHYVGSGGGYSTSDGVSAIWVDGVPYSGKEVVNGPYPGFTTDTDYQIASIKMGSIPEITWPDGAESHIWVRMGHNTDGSWNGYGVKLQIGYGELRLSRYNNFVETTMRVWQMFLPPIFDDEWSLVAGYGDDNPRLFKVLRNGIPVRSFQETGTGSAIGSGNRGVGWGERAGAGLISQATPAVINWFGAGDNTAATRSGFLSCTNIGDQPMFRDYTLIGPGTFRIYDGPNTTDYVEFGPTLTNQVVFLRTDPRSHTVLVQDLSTVPTVPQQLNVFQEAVKTLTDALGPDSNAFFQQIQSAFGIQPPQGPMYGLLTGRFSDNSAIPAKSPGYEAQPYLVQAQVTGGNADSQIISAGTPLRRYPI